VDLVVEQVGRATWRGSAESVRRGGRIVTCGATSGAEVSLNLQDLYRREISLLGSYAGTPDEVRRVFKLVADSKLRAVIDRSYPLEEAAAAHARMEESGHFGKLVLSFAQAAAPAG
jgi:NADPH:quinone reductase-like Zn-dependent oxidoreductase